MPNENATPENASPENSQPAAAPEKGAEAAASTPATPPAAQAQGAPAKTDAISSLKDFKLKSGKELAFEAKRQAQAAASAVKHFFTRKENIWAELPDIFPSLFSSDKPTRRMSLLFICSLLGAILVTWVGLYRYWESKKVVILAETQRKAKHFEDMIRREAEETKRRGSLITLGNFTVELMEVAKQQLGVGEVNMAEIEIVLLCDGQETRDFIEQSGAQVRNQMTNILVPINREELLSREGKKRLKTLMVRKLNEWLPHGKIEDVYFAKVVLK